MRTDSRDLIKITKGNVKVVCENVDTGEKLTGLPAKIYNELQKSDVPVNYEHLCAVLWQQKPDYFLLRSFDVHLGKVKKFVRSVGLDINRVRGQSVQLITLKQ